jgi:hypothetical protein
MSWLTPFAEEYRAAYEASLPPEVLAACKINDEHERTAALKNLAISQPFPIDVPIMAWRWHPYVTMAARWAYGYTWVPSALQPVIELGPGFSMPGMKPYDPDNPPVGSIKVINPADRAQWPAPFNPPVAPPARGTDLVGELNPVLTGMFSRYGQCYNANRDAVGPDGQFVVGKDQPHHEDGHTFTFRVENVGIGQVWFFSL